MPLNKLPVIEGSPNEDPFLKASYSIWNRTARVSWKFIYLLFFRFTPRPMHPWRSFILRMFGAKLGPNCHIYPKAQIWAPWNLICADQVTFADGAVIYNPQPMRFGSHAIISQEAYLCGATHDYNSPEFPLIASEMTFGAYSWICAKAIVGPGVHVGDGAVLGLGSTAVKALDPWTVYAGAPAIARKERRRFSSVAI